MCMPALCADLINSCAHREEGNVVAIDLITEHIRMKVRTLHPHKIACSVAS